MIIKNVYPFDRSGIQELTDLRITGRTVTEVSPHISPEDGEEIIDGRGMMVLPGMADSHRHVWQSGFKGVASEMMLLTYLDKVMGEYGAKLTADDMYYLNLYGYLEAAAAGVTTIFDWSHATNSSEHADAVIQAALDAKIKVLYFHSTPAIDRGDWWNNSQRNHDRDIIRLAKAHGAASPDLKFGIGIRGPEFATAAVNRHDLELAKELNIPASMHVGSSILGKIHKPVIQLAEQGLLNDKLNFVHCNTLNTEEFSLINEAGCLISVTPEAELQMGLGNPISEPIFKHKGLRWSIGLDVASAVSNSMIFQKRLHLQYLRGAANHQLIENMQMPMEMPMLSTDLFFNSIYQANAFAGFNNSSEIRVGSDADFSLISLGDLETGAFKKSPSFAYLNERDINSVMVSGSFVIQNGRYNNLDMESVKSKVHAITERILQ